MDFRGDLDANANHVLLPGARLCKSLKETDLVKEDGGARLGETALALLTALCGRTVLSPAFFLGPERASYPIQALTISGAPSPINRPMGGTTGEPGTKAKRELYLRSHKMAGLKELLLSEKLNTHAISLQLTAQSQVQLGGRKLREDTKEVKNEKDSRDPNSSRPKRARKE